jgi:hypothetical protein
MASLGWKGLRPEFHSRVALQTHKLHEAKPFFRSNKFCTVYGNRRYMTMFTTARHLHFAGKSIEPTRSNRNSRRFIAILSFHPLQGLPSCFFPPCFPTKILYKKFTTTAMNTITATSRTLFLHRPEPERLQRQTNSEVKAIP